MTTEVDIANQVLQALGLQKRVSSLSQDSAEAAAIKLIIYYLRDDLLRKAPWNCAQKTANLTYITSSPGTPENPSAATTLWQPGQPPPPWCYEYQYPSDCLRALWLIPATQTGFAGGIPITTAVTGGAAAFWQGPPVKFKVVTDQFYPVTAAAVANGGSGNAVGDVLTLAATPSGAAPIGAPAQLLVTSIGGGGAVTGVSIVPVLGSPGTPESIGGSYFAKQTNPVGVSATTGSGDNLATFNLTFGAQAPQRVIVTNQEFATLAYVQQVTDPNVMDTLFLRAWVHLIAAYVAVQLLQDPKAANIHIQITNQLIAEARQADGNEGLTINDVTPDWIRIRGVDFPEPYSGPYSGVDWGGMYPIFG